jgi:bifunctional N-acetylglucosamine-1-phosphate-uridyltransferase/glucosamine-1-phosphate-acetyltransferase GlmU-like protein
MSSAPIHVVVLAAGQGTRMKSSLPKVLHGVPGGSMLKRVIRIAEALSPETLTVVVGHGADAVRARSSGRPTPSCRPRRCSRDARERWSCCLATFRC